MKKTIFAFLTVVAIAGGIVLSMFMMSKEKNNIQESETDNTQIADKVTDECIDEYDEMETEQVEEANSNEVEKVSPNAIITFQKFYIGCEHTQNTYEKVENDLVNATKEEVENKYRGWNLKEFTADKIVLYQEVEGECGEHYMLRDENGKINIYQLDEDGDETLLEETDIATEYLTEIDMIDMENGLIVYGKESLNKLLEDFE